MLPVSGRAPGLRLAPAPGHRDTGVPRCRPTRRRSLRVSGSGSGYRDRDQPSSVLFTIIGGEHSGSSSPLTVTRSAGATPRVLCDPRDRDPIHVTRRVTRAAAGRVISPRTGTECAVRVQYGGGARYDRIAPPTPRRGLGLGAI
eukprot:54521-Rhodomonas_salina.1